MIAASDLASLPQDEGVSFISREKFRAIASTDYAGAIRRRAPIEFLQPFEVNSLAQTIVESNLIEANEIFVAEIPNATLIGDRAFVTNSYQLLVTDSFHSNHTSSIFELAERCLFEGVPLSRVGGDYVYSDFSVETIEINGKVIALTAMESGNYGAFLLRLIPKIIAIKQQGLLNTRIVAPICMPWQKQLLSIFGVDVAAVIPHDRKKKYKADRMIVPSMRTSEFFQDDGCQNFYHDIARKIIKARRDRKFDYLYISRIKQGRLRPHYRQCANEQELVDALIGRGFHIFEPESHSIEDQIYAFATAKVVVGPGGAGMFNTVFCSPGTKIISIEPMIDWLGLHLNLFAGGGHDYAIIYGGADQTDKSTQKRWRVDVKQTIALIDRLCQ